MNRRQKEKHKGWEHTEVISDARRSRSWTKKESSSFVLDMGVIVMVKEGRSASAGAREIHATFSWDHASMRETVGLRIPVRDSGPDAESF